MLTRKVISFSLPVIFVGILIILWFFFRNTVTEADYTPQYSEESSNISKIYLFGVHPLHNPERLFEVYQPLVDFINLNIQDAKLKLYASRNYAAYDERLFNGEFHFALPNPYQTIESIKHGYHVFGKMGDDNNFRGIILVRRDSDIEEVEDLIGKAVSYPAPTALAATMMPQWYFYTHGLDINKDIENRYVGSQESSIMNVYLDQTAAGATWPPPWQAIAKERPDIADALIVKWETEPILNNGLVFREDVPSGLVDIVSKLLFSLHTHEEGRIILNSMELSKFESANNSTYLPVVKFLERFEKEVRPIRGDK